MNAPRLFGLAVAATLALAACTPTPAASPSPSGPPVTSAAPTPSASAAPSPAPVFDPHPPLEDLVVTTSGILPLTIGVELADNPGAAMLFFDEDYCWFSEEMGLTSGDLGRWIADYTLGTHSDGWELGPFHVDVPDGFPLWRIDIFTEDLVTPEGIGIGSTLADVQATYPGLVAGASGVRSQVWWIAGAEGYVVFETQDNSDGLLPDATEPVVILMRVISADADPDFAAANSGNVAGACF